MYILWRPIIQTCYLKNYRKPGSVPAVTNSRIFKFVNQRMDIYDETFRTIHPEHRHTYIHKQDVVRAKTSSLLILLNYYISVQTIKIHRKQPFGMNVNHESVC